MARSALESPNFKPGDAERHRLIAAVGYMLFLIPLLGARGSAFAMYHANQSLQLLLAALIVNIALALIPAAGWLLTALANCCLLALALLGIRHALRGKCRALPGIGGWSLLRM